MKQKKIGAISAIILLLLNITGANIGRSDVDNQTEYVAQNREEDIPIVG